MDELPDGTHLTYVIGHEMWYARQSVPASQPEIYISGSCERTGVSWGFSVKETDLGEHGTAICLEIFEDAFAAFTAIPGFFATLAEDEVDSLAEVREQLNRSGAGDETKRDPDYAFTPGQAAFTQYHLSARQPPPSWVQQPPAVRAGWEAVARAARGVKETGDKDEQ